MPPLPRLPLVLLCFLPLQLLSVLAQLTGPQRHSSNYAVIVQTSRYWLNYRHASNALSIYRTVKRLGIPDRNILLMLADDMACSPRNPYPATVYNNESHAIDVYGKDVEVDYRGYEVNVENLIRVLTGRHEPSVPRSKRLLSDAGSNILLYLSGHGGDQFLKFQDSSELMAPDLAAALWQMHGKGRYHEVLVVVDSCEAATMVDRIQAPGVVAIASSVKGQSSFSYLNDFLLGQPVADRLTAFTLNAFEELLARGGPQAVAAARLPHLFPAFSYQALGSTFAVHTTRLQRALGDMRLLDFFGAVAVPRPLLQPYPLQEVSADGQGTDRGGWRGGAGGGEAGGPPGAPPQQHHAALGGKGLACPPALAPPGLTPQAPLQEDWAVALAVAALSGAVMGLSWLHCRV